MGAGGYLRPLWQAQLLLQAGLVDLLAPRVVGLAVVLEDVGVCFRVPVFQVYTIQHAIERVTPGG